MSCAMHSKSGHRDRPAASGSPPHHCPLPVPDPWRFPWPLPLAPADLVFIQNGMLQPWLDSQGLGDNTQVRGAGRTVAHGGSPGCR